MTPQSDRIAALRHWETLAAEALALAGHVDYEPSAAVLALAENALRWPLPRAGALRCRALARLVETYALSGALPRGRRERAAMAPALKALARACLDLTEASRGEAADPNDHGVSSREPRKDIFG